MKKSCVNENVFVQGFNQEKIRHYLPGDIFPLSVHFFKVLKMTLQCLKLKWRSKRFYGKVWSISNLISLKCRSGGSAKWLRFYQFFTMSRRIALKKQRRVEPSVLFLFSVLS